MTNHSAIPLRRVGFAGFRVHIRSRAHYNHTALSIPTSPSLSHYQKAHKPSQTGLNMGSGLKAQESQTHFNECLGFEVSGSQTGCNKGQTGYEKVYCLRLRGHANPHPPSNLVSSYGTIAESPSSPPLAAPRSSPLESTHTTAPCRSPFAH